MEVKQSEILRYLGYRKIDPTPEVIEKVNTCLKKLIEVSIPQSTYQVFDLDITGDDMLLFADLKVHSANLSHNAQGCTKIAMMAATIGIGVDRLIARAEIQDMADAAIYQAAGAAMVEAYVDDVNREIIAKAKKMGLYCRPRFSPGYGDLPLTLQKDFARILDMSKNCGISLGDTLLMSPSKSVTALIPMGTEGKDCELQGCELCSNYETCEFRR